MENFIVSARKYRPATFNSVVGQKHITSTLKNAISRQQLAHAYLFCGPRGVGKTTCARIFAKSINCLSPVDNEACGVCESCRAQIEGRSFNIHELDAASNNSVDDIRSLTEQVRIPPQIGKYSVYIIDEVHMLSASAFNAFLKTLEEPPAHAIFVLATTEKHKILPTILSRCQIFDFNRIGVEDAVEYLRDISEKEGVTVDDESLYLIAQKADGGMRDALSMYDKAVSFCGKELNYKTVAESLNILDYDTYFNIIDVIISGDYQTALVAFDDVLRKGFSGQLFLSGLGGHMRDLLVCKNPQTKVLLEVTGRLLDRYTEQAAKCSSGFLFNAIALITSIDGTLRTATNQRLNIELGLMKLCGLGQKKNEQFESVALELPPLSKSSQQSVATPKITAEPVKGEQQKPVTVEPPTVVEPPKMETRAAIHAMPVAISGSSIADIMKSQGGAVSSSDEPDVEVVEEVEIDPYSERKINQCKELFISKIKESRPRFAVVFMDMLVDGHVINVTVPNETLYEDILRNKGELLIMLKEMSGVSGFMDLNVVIVEDDPSKRLPIKGEDRLKYLTDMNPMLTKFRQELALELD